MSSELARLCREGRQLVRQTGHFIQTQAGKVKQKEIEVKSLNSLVSYVDKEAEEQLVEGLHALLPEAGFITEEDTIENTEKEWQWIIDPLDGTTNFLHQVPVYCISVGLRRAGELVMGIVLEINREECFYGWKDGGVFVNQNPINVSRDKPLSDALLATGFPYHDYERAEAYLRVLHRFMRDTRGIRRLGAAAVDLAFVAAGRFDGFYEYSLQPWDVAGGAFLVQEAGGIVTDFSGTDNFLFGEEVIAASPAIHAEILQVVKAEFN